MSRLLGLVLGILMFVGCTPAFAKECRCSCKQEVTVYRNYYGDPYAGAMPSESVMIYQRCREEGLGQFHEEPIQGRQLFIIPPPTMGIQPAFSDYDDGLLAPPPEAFEYDPGLDLYDPPSHRTGWR